MNKKILLSTDIGSDPDDALSLLAMLNNPNINLRGIYTVNGKVDCRAYIAKHMINLHGKNIPICVGASKPIGAETEPYTFFEEFLVDYDSFVDKEKTEAKGHDIYKPFKKVGIIENGLEHMAEQLSQDSHIVFSIGPLTNIALLLREYQQVIRNIERLYIMGSNIEGNLEHNFRFDSTATQEILSSDIPITLIPSNLCSKFKMPTDMLEQMKNTSAGRYVKMMARAYIGEKLIDDCSYELIDNENFINFLRHLDIFNNEGRLNGKELMRLKNFKKYFLTNFEPRNASLEQEDFWEKFNKFIEQLENPNINYTYEGSYMGTHMGKMTAEKLKSLIQKSVSVADVYVPYCFLHPEKLKIERKTISCDFKGKTYILPGEKHVVVDLDYTHFREFLRKNLF